MNWKQKIAVGCWVGFVITSSLMVINAFTVTMVTNDLMDDKITVTDATTYAESSWRETKSLIVINISFMISGFVCWFWPNTSKTKVNIATTRPRMEE